MNLDSREQLNLLFLEHRTNVSRHLLNITFVYLLLSISWNSVFSWFQLPYSRASLPVLIVCMAVWTGIRLIAKAVPKPDHILPHLVIAFHIFLFGCLYFGSGYHEAWSFFLIVPMVAGIYCDRLLMVIYSTAGLIVLFAASSLFPIGSAEGVYRDAVNRSIYYILLCIFGYTMLITLSRLYQSRVATIENSLQMTIDQVVKSFVISVEAKDQYTSGHSERVGRYAVELAKFLPEYQKAADLQKLQFTGAIHDIGKINIPAEILTKADPLTEVEYEIIKTHPIAGARMLEKMPVLYACKDGVLFHHERWDGKGYPTQRAGADIPLEARILAVADAFDAMTSSRAYRKELSMEEAFSRLHEGSGTQFDPSLLEQLENAKSAWTAICMEGKSAGPVLEKGGKINVVLS